MGKAVPGDGVLRTNLTSLSSIILQNAQNYESLALENEGTTRNNLDTTSAEIGLAAWKEILRIAQRCLPMLQAAYDHHAAQTSVLPNNIFGQRRRIKNGCPTVIDPLDPTKVAKRLNDDGFSNLTPQQQAIYWIHGTHPHTNFQSWSPQQQRRYLIGEFNPNLTEEKLP